MRWFWLLGLTLAAWEDLRSREFPYWIFWFWLIPGLGNVVTDSVWKHLGAASVGTGMLLVSRVTGGALGAGDGLFFLLSACYLDLQETVLLFLMALGISCLWSMTAVLRSFATAAAGKTMTIPFLACAWLPGLWLICR